MIGLYVILVGMALFLIRQSFPGRRSACCHAGGFPRDDHVGKRVFHQSNAEPADVVADLKAGAGAGCEIRQDRQTAQPRIITYLNVAGLIFLMLSNHYPTWAFRRK